MLDYQCSYKLTSEDAGLSVFTWVNLGGYWCSSPTSLFLEQLFHSFRKRRTPQPKETIFCPGHQYLWRCATHSLWDASPRSSADRVCLTRMSNSDSGWQLSLGSSQDGCSGELSRLLQGERQPHLQESSAHCISKFRSVLFYLALALTLPSPLKLEIQL